MIKKTFLALFLVVLISACDSDDRNSNSQNDGFDRSAMLVNWADNIIIPVYEDLNTKLQDLAVQKDAFIARVKISEHLGGKPTKYGNMQRCSMLVWLKV